jgi:ATP-dependent Clp protease ATP-binding subunit ClpC
MYTLHDDIQNFKPAVALATLVNRRALGTIRIVGGVMLIGGGAVAATLYFFPEPLAPYTMYRNIAAGVGLLGLAAWLDSLMGTMYHNSYYFKGMQSVLGLEEIPAQGATYDVAEVVLKNTEDIGKAFVDSTIGQTILIRSGLTMDAIGSYRDGSRQTIRASMVTLPEEEIFSLIGLGKFIITNDVAFAAMLKQAGIQEQTFIATLRWVVGTQHQYKRQLRWWSRDNLSQTSSIGRGLSLGTAYLLQKFARDIRTTAIFSTLTRDSAFAKEKITEIEQTLARAKASNVLLIGESGVGKTDLLIEVARRMRTGQSLDALTNEHLVVLDTNRLFALHADKQSLEQTIIAMFSEAAQAGHVIVVIENISTVIKEAQALGVYLPELLDEYLSLPDVHIIGTETPHAYHSHLETLGGFTRRFAEILIETPDHGATTRVLQSIALKEETKRNILFTYNAIDTTAIAADRHIVEGVMPDKAVALLLDVADAATASGTAYITEDFVHQVVSDKTGIPTGPIKPAERDQLLHLEDIMHGLVAGQDQAITAIAKTLRRARTNIQAIDKPIGSFLFLGPTGVGKTETAKALATVFFGGEHNLQRLDMSEYSGDQSLEQLIGNTNQAGALPSLLREHPYSVLLLDEFEKASQSVHDVFLQILDEGVFTDGRVQRVNARNTIIIATSNAGSKLILETVQSRGELDQLNQNIIDHIITEGLFRPELINRFDNIVIFEPLSISEQATVANLMLKELYKRIEQKGYQLQVGEDLLTLLVEKGYHPEFGARPMRRVIQDVIEGKIATKIISGTVQKGDTISLTTADFSEAELAA